MKGKLIITLSLVPSVVILLLLVQIHSSGSTSIFKLLTHTSIINDDKSNDSNQLDNDLMLATMSTTKLQSPSERVHIVSSVDKLLPSNQMNQPNLHMIRSKNKRDDNFGGAFGKGIGFFVGEPCLDTLQCNPILFNVYCNQSTGRCECTSDFPVNIYNRVCVKALRLGESCEFHESCRHLDSNAICNEDELKCRCQEYFYPRITDNGTPECIQVRAIFSPTHWLPWVTLVTSLVAMGALAFGCTVLRRLSNNSSRSSVTDHSW